jgi:RNA polymerase sigma-70 factor, ECF subfamily
MQPAAPTAEVEALWIRKIANQDRGAFEDLYRAYRRRLFAYAFRLTGNAERAAEVTNDVMLTVWKQAARFEGHSKPSTWIFGIAHNIAINAAQRDPWRRMTGIEDAGGMAAPGNLPLDAERADLRRRLRGALSELSDDHREVMELTFFQGLSYEEIAAVQGCPVNTVKTRMFHAKKRLQPLLTQLGIGMDSL